MIDVIVTTINNDNNKSMTFVIKWKGDCYDLAEALRSWNHPMKDNLAPLTPHPDGWDEKDCKKGGDTTGS